MNKMTFIIPFLILIAACNLSTDTNPWNTPFEPSKIVNSQLIPGAKSLDSIADNNSDLLYYWTRETAQNEKNILNYKDLNIKTNRKVALTFKNKEYFLYPFFKKTASNSKILALHFLLIKKDLNIDQLKDISFKDLSIINSEKAYYYYGLR